MDERIERIRKGLNAVVNFGLANGASPQLIELKDLDSIEADLAKLATVTKERDVKKAVIDDHIEDEEMAKEALKPYLTEFELEGDSYGVPGFVQWIETLIEKYKSVTHERDVARRALGILDKMSGCKGSDCPEWKLPTDKCDCNRAALTMAEKELENDHPFC